MNTEKNNADAVMMSGFALGFFGAIVVITILFITYKSGVESGKNITCDKCVERITK